MRRPPERETLDAFDCQVAPAIASTPDIVRRRSRKRNHPSIYLPVQGKRMSLSCHFSRASLRRRIVVMRSGDRRKYFRRKAAVDRVFAAALLIASLPILTLCWLLIRGSSRGPVFSRQKRVGHCRREFTLWRFRTMTLANPIRYDSLDPTATRIGSILSAFHLDGLPQLWNVVRGDMSFVGPRAERPEIASVLEQSIPNYGRRLAVRPGLTGLAQLNLPKEGGLVDAKRRVMLDIDYIGRATIMLDCRLILRAGLRLLPSPASVSPLFSLSPRPAHAPPSPPPSSDGLTALLDPPTRIGSDGPAKNEETGSLAF
jgi:lipopolysaccharide/colanic/teichoic acid biosynthesis glycosyltransferase